MGETTRISWADATFNIAIGCQKISEGCTYCYAERDMENPKYGTRWKGLWDEHGMRAILSDAYWKKPLAWQRKLQKENRRARVFTSSLCDIFEKHVEITLQRLRLWDLIKQTPNIDWMLLTKRIERAAECWPWKTLAEAPKNVWIGTTIENQARAIQRLPWLLRIPAWLHFVSCEPLLGSINFRFEYVDEDGTRCEWDTLAGYHEVLESNSMDIITSRALGDEIPIVDWIIGGGETGKHARPTNPRWAEFLQDQAAQHGIPFHWKQWGEWRPAQPGDTFNTLDGMAGNPPAFLIDCCGDVHCTWDAAGKNAVPVVRVGKKHAGRLIDGQLYDAVPASVA